MTSVLPPHPAPAPTRASLSLAMREGSAAQHRAAEEVSFVSELLAGRLGREAYVDYLRCLRAVYDTLEAVVRHRAADPVVAAVHDRALERSASLARDLVAWGAAPDAANPVPAPVEAYVARLGEVAVGPATRVLAHHYTRYLGDLSGGRVIGQSLRRTFGLAADGEGLAFYDFATVTKPKPYKDAYRARLDQLPLSEDERTDVVAEVRLAFDLNREMLLGLGRRHCDPQG